MFAVVVVVVVLLLLLLLMMSLLLMLFLLLLLLLMCLFLLFLPCFLFFLPIQDLSIISLSSNRSFSHPTTFVPCLFNSTFFYKGWFGRKNESGAGDGDDNVVNGDDMMIVLNWMILIMAT